MATFSFFFRLFFNEKFLYAEVPGLILAAVLVDKIGRKFSMVFMYALGFLFLLPLVLQQDEALTTLLLSGARMCFLGTFTITVIYCPEVIILFYFWIVMSFLF